MKQRLFWGVLVFAGALEAQNLKIIREDWRSPMQKEAPMSLPLKRLKMLENTRKFSECAESAESVFRRHESLRGWILTTWLRCARRADEADGRVRVAKALRFFDQNTSWIERGPWRNGLFQEQLRSRLDHSEARWKHSPADVAMHLQRLQLQWDRLDKESKSRVWALYGELSAREKNPEQALQFFRQSLGEKEQKQVRDRFQSLLLALGKTDSKAVDLGPTVDLLSEDEKKAEDRFMESVKTNDLMNLVDDGVSYLNRFPGGRRNKMIADRVFEAFLNLVDSVQTPPAAREKAIKSLLRADSARLLDWMRALHRRGSYEVVLPIAEVLSRVPNSTVVSVAMYLGGRSAQFVGDWAQAKRFFEKYVETNSGGEDIVEVMFRLSLVYLREGQFSTGIAQLEKLLLQKQIDRYELSSRYWLVRALQWTSNSRAGAESAAVVQKFPQSYYGLRLKAEQSPEQNPEKKLSPMKSSGASVAAPQFGWTPLQKSGVERALLLSRHGWIAEAQAEMQDLSVAAEPIVKAFLGRKWAQLGAVHLGVRAINEAGDQDARFRDPQFVESVFPKFFPERVEAEATTQNLAPVLVWSLIRQESAFQIRATSSSNALGLMQLIPPTAAETIQDLRLESRFGKLQIPEDVYDPEINIRLGSYYLGKMIRQFSGSVPAGLAAYNAGPTRLQAFLKFRPEAEKPEMAKPGFEELWFDEIPWFETSFYVKAILRNVLIYQMLDGQSVKVHPQFWKDLVRVPNPTSTSTKIRKTSPSLRAKGNSSPGSRG